MPGRIIRFVRDAVREPREELTKRQRQLRFGWDLCIYCWKQLRRLRADGMAAELTYRTIFSLVPVVVLGLVVFRIVGGLEEVQETVEQRLYSFFGVPDVAYGLPQPVDPVPADPSVSANQAKPANPQVDAATLNSPEVRLNAAAPNEEFADDAPTAEMVAEESRQRKQEVQASIRKTLSELTNKISHLDFASIGIIGLLLFVYAAVALADAVEHIFNMIFDAPEFRPVHLRVAIHWSIITLGSGLLAISLYQSGKLVTWLSQETDLGSGGTQVLNRILAVLASWILLFLLYALMPNTTVSTRAAAIGAFVAAVLWEAAKFGFQIYVLKALPYSALYGSLGLIPLFLFWVYITWLIVLFGLILTYTLQTAAGRIPTTSDAIASDLPAGDPNWMLPVLVEVARMFKTGDVANRQHLSNTLGLPIRVVRDMCGRLENAGFLRSVVTEESKEAITLARPAEEMKVGHVLELGDYENPMSNCGSWKYLSTLRAEQRRFAENKTVADLLR